MLNESQIRSFNYSQIKQCFGPIIFQFGVSLQPITL